MSCPKTPTVYVSTLRNNTNTIVPNHEVHSGDVIHTTTPKGNKYKDVTDVFPTYMSPDRQRHITLVNGIELICSDNHAIICKRDGVWEDIFPDDLTEQHVVITSIGDTSVLKVSHYNEHQSCTFYDILVYDNHYYCGLNPDIGMVLCYN